MLYLASQSPRRRELLGQLGANFSILDVDVEEVPFPEEAPIDYVQRVARDKALAGWEHLTREAQADALVIASDTEVVLDRRVFGKPKDADDAVDMLQALSGHTHEVISAVCMVSGKREEGDVSISRVRFAALSEPEINAYVATGEPFGKAGAYAIQGRGATLIEHLEGSYSGVMGLPLFETARLLRSFGVAV
ncbi:Maf family protein [Dyella humi]|uniref:dTTP/UTP pyrophosphatase n=1 Tax=Dyella humi TaxID=1770547 RepID=A0ABW8IIV0_9GAMM